MNRISATTTTFLALLMLPNFAWAQIVYQPAAAGTAIPTLTTTALLLVIVLLVAVAKFAGFNHGKIVSVLALCAVASGAIGVKIVSDAYADVGGGTNFGFFSSANGGSAPISDGVLNIFENTSGTNQRIISINPGACPDRANGLVDGVEQCLANKVITTGQDGLCYTDCRPLGMN